ncbi:hypothetical protein [Fimbriiglobus ruber]|uniref:Uncharacterized protein n=1 Tax=Fimbriiglobus ruber TaxID=1908690 RepID=A0A225DAF0_9BACT|nr:hypothetical protein [Fimbriiglobus ruber]OWK34276.1 hypothetical protein FRUB_10247 [Fimbriiglobus ruber]
MSSYSLAHSGNARITQAERDEFRNSDPIADIGYHHIYRRPEGTTFRVADPFTKKKFGTYPSVIAAVNALVLWCRYHYGPNWVAVYRGREICTYEIQRVRGNPDVVVCNERGRKVLAKRGFRLVAHVWGVPQVVLPPVSRGYQPLDHPRGEHGRYSRAVQPVPCSLFISKEAALAHYAVWRRLGLFEPIAPLVYRRAASSTADVEEEGRLVAA